MHLLRISSGVCLPRASWFGGVQKTRELSSGVALSVSDLWQGALHRASTIPAKFTPASCLETHGSGFFVPREQSLVFPYLKASESEARWLMMGNNDRDMGVLYSCSSIFEDYFPDGRSSYGLAGFTLALGKHAQQDSGALLLREKMPNTFRLALDAGARNHMLSKKPGVPTSITMRLVVYRLAWASYVNSAHKDGAPAVHVPLLREGCSATTVFRDTLEGDANVSISGTDQPCFTDDGVYHQVVVSQTDARCKNPRRVLMNVMTTYHQ